MDLREWEPWLISHIPLSGRTFIDVGASTGLYSQYLKLGFKRVIAIEPNPAASAELERNVTGITIIRAAAWSAKGRKTLYTFESLMHGSFFNSSPNWQTMRRLADIEVELFTIDSLGLIDVDFIKIDTEGSEVEVLKGTEHTLRTCHSRLLIEVHTEQYGNEILELLRNLEYKPQIVRHPNYPPGSQYFNVHFWIDAS